jgi:hypothetical protein
MNAAGPVGGRLVADLAGNRNTCFLCTVLHVLNKVFVGNFTRVFVTLELIVSC